MRDKEAMEIEKKNLLKNLEKQGKAVERLVDTENSLKGQIVSQLSLKRLTCSTRTVFNNQSLLEKETLMQKKIIETLKENLRQQEKSHGELFSRVEQERGRCEAVRAILFLSLVLCR